jgi:hypothetical protein
MVFIGDHVDMGSKLSLAFVSTLGALPLGYKHIHASCLLPSTKALLGS